MINTQTLFNNELTQYLTFALADEEYALLELAALVLPRYLSQWE